MDAFHDCDVFIHRWEDRRFLLEFLFSLQAFGSLKLNLSPNFFFFFYHAVSPVSDPAVDTS